MSIGKKYTFSFSYKYTIIAFSVAIFASTMFLGSHLQYFDFSQCHNESAQSELKDAFIQSLLNNPRYNTECGQYCSPENVTITCGSSGRRKRSTSVATITFRLIASLDPSLSPYQSTKAANNQLNQLADVLATEVASGRLDLQVLGSLINADRTSFDTGDNGIVCPLGRKSNIGKNAINCSKLIILNLM